ncbi:hypothetical protein B9Z65_468 [Elsinoe australis]|uniref:rRNA-processing protein FYV7 n=1 Tax=Elsinoe australis TaxID=40998 RepID=A0A2P8AIL1_9PEZI|nr:hypothetical protein B9Z65_468 [Elsinoe australis]
MGIKRPATDSSDRPAKKTKKPFSVGPANLPDGQWKRRNQRIKRSLIDKAKLRKDYTKLKAQQTEEPAPARELRYYEEADAEAEAAAAAAAKATSEEDGDEVEEAADKAHENKPEPSNAPHPDRQILMDREPSPPRLPERNGRRDGGFERRETRPRAVPFAREAREAAQRKKEAEERNEARERAMREREQKMEERERFRRAMAKARTGGKTGQRKLGRESGVLLEKVKRIMGS